MILDLFIYIIQFYINQNTFLPGFIIRKKKPSLDGFCVKYNFQRMHACPWLIDQSFLYQDKPYDHLDIHQL